MQQHGKLSRDMASHVRTTSSQFSHVMSTDVGLPKFVKSMPSLIVLHGHAAVTLHRVQSVTIYGMGFMGFMGAFETE